MKKFEKNDIFVNRVKVYPKVSFFVNSGSLGPIWYNGKPNGGALELNKFLTLPTIVVSGSVVDTTYYLITESSIELIAEDGTQLVTEQQP